MKKLAIFIFYCITFLSGSLYAQEQLPLLTHDMSQEEALRKNEIGRSFVPTDPPAPPARAVAEFEEMQSVLIRYPFGIPMSLIIEMAEDCHVKTIVADSSQQTLVLNQYLAAGVDTANCEWLITPTNSYWARDYGLWFVVNGNDETGISDFPITFRAPMMIIYRWS
jgi:agmatine deiminase